MRSKATLIIVIYLSGFGILSWTLNRIFGGLFAQFNISNRAILGENFSLATLVGVLVAAAIMGYFWANKNAKQFVSEVIDEISKVAWPDWDETRSSTIVVLVFTFITAGILGVFDSIFSWLTSNHLFLF